jgi:hypothetical protein
VGGDRRVDLNPRAALLALDDDRLVAEGARISRVLVDADSR